jgi:hypothetical protein
MKYKSSAQTGGNNAGASYLHYGDPGLPAGRPPRVIARYVQTRVANGPALYGWMVWQHHYNPDGTNPDGSPVVVNHFSPL